jgi:hypothetical protein
MSVLVYDGPSLLDGTPIIVTLSGVYTPSRNRKTGPMAQAHILVRDTPPHEAIKTGNDRAICGDCPHRNGSCYVLAHQGPLVAWRTAAAPTRVGFQLHTRSVRLGAYGDPAAVPTRTWQQLLRGTKRHTGYTHQWRDCDPALKTWCMASVDTDAEAADAQAKGWRTFRIRAPDTPTQSNEIECPHTTHGVQCINCGLCAGTSVDGKHIVQTVHGAQWKQQRFLEWAA